MRHDLVAIAVIIAVLVCSPGAIMQSQNRAAGSSANPPGRDTVVQFSLPNLAGGFMTNEDLKGKVAVIDIWASWCHPCIAEIPIYNRLYDFFQGQDVAIVGIAVDSTRRDIQSRVRQLRMIYPILIGNDQTLQAFGRIQVFPTTVVLTKE